MKEPAGDRDTEAAEARVRCCEKRESQGKKTLRLKYNLINKLSRGTLFRVQNLCNRFCALAITKTKGQSNSERVCTELPVVLVERAHNEGHVKMFERIP